MSRARRNGAFVVAGLLVALLLAVVVSPFASSHPDGLEKVAIDEGFAETETDHALADSPAAGYQVDGVDSGRAGTALAGAVGVVITFAVTAGLGVLVHRVQRARRRGVATAPPAL